MPAPSRASAPSLPSPAPSRTASGAAALRLGAWLLAAALLAVPLVFSSQTQDQFELPKQLLLRALSSLMLGTLLAALLSDAGFRWRRTPLDWPVLAWCAWLLACTLHSVSPAVSWRGEYENFAGSLTQLDYAAVYFLAVQFCAAPERARLACRAVLAASVGAALYALMQSLGRDFMGWSASSVVSNRYFGSLGNPNFLGGLMAMAICLRLGLASEAWGVERPEDGDQPWRWLVLGLWVLAYLSSGRADLLNPFTRAAGASDSGALILVLWLLALPLAPLLRRLGRFRSAFGLALAADLLLFFQALAGTATRGAFLGLLVGLAVLVPAWLSTRRKDRPGEAAPAAGTPGRRGLRALLGLVLLALALAALFAGLGPAFRRRTLASLRHPEQALEVSRLEIWRPALHIWRDHPLMGTGVDTFKTVFPRYTGSRFAEYDGQNVASRMAHCEPLQILATQGAVGLALWVWLCAAAFLAWASRLRRAGAQERALLLGLGPLLAAYLAQNLVSFGVAGISVPFWAGLGLLFCGPGPEARRPGLPVLSPAWAWTLGAALALAGCRLDVQTLRADLDFAFANQAQDQLADLDAAPADEAQEAADYCLRSLDTWGAPLAPDLKAEVDAWEGRVAAAEAQGAQPGSEQALAPFYRQAAGVLLMALSAARLEQAVALCPGEVKYRVYLGLCYEELFKRCDPDRRALWFKAADASYALGVALNPGNAYYRGDQARLWSFGAESGDRDFFTQSQAYYLQAVARAPVTRLFYENLLQEQARFADLQDADRLLAEAVAADKEKAVAPRLLLEAASTFFQYRGSDLAPWDAALKKQAQAYETRWASQAAALAPGSADDALALAVFEAQQGRRALADAWAHKALALDPTLSAAVKFLKEGKLP